MNFSDAVPRIEKPILEDYTLDRHACISSRRKCVSYSWISLLGTIENR